MANGEYPREAWAAPVDGLENFSARTRGAVRSSLTHPDIKPLNGTDGIRNLDGVDLNQLFLGEPATKCDLAEEKQAIQEKVDEKPEKIKAKKMKIRKKLNELDQDDIRKLDLHGYTKDDVDSLVRKLIFAGKRYGEEFVLIITGWGQRSQNGPVLKPEVEKQLDKYIDEGRIKRYQTAPPKLGGIGAIVVILK